MRDIAYIALGSNLGDRAGQLARAREAIAALPNTRMVRESAIDETEPIGPAQPWFLNQMIAVETSPRYLAKIRGVNETARVCPTQSFGSSPPAQAMKSQRLPSFTRTSV